MSLAKATLRDIENSKNSIEFMFNPNELTFSRSMNWDQSEGARTEDGNPKTSFKHPNPYSLTISNIILDRYEEQKSVLPDLEKFMRAVEFMDSGDEKGKRPPIYLFTWGAVDYLRCYVTSLDFNLNLFLPDGTPVRAIISSLKLEQADQSNPSGNQSTPFVTSSQRSSGGRN